MILDKYIKILKTDWHLKPIYKKEKADGGRVFDGKKFGDAILEILKGLKIHPRVGVIQVGARPESCLYIENKKRALESIGGEVQIWRYEEEISEEDLCGEIQRIQKGKKQGLLLQLPLPQHIDSRKVINLIKPENDIDGLTTYNQSLLYEYQTPLFIPCTPLGIVIALKSIYEDLSGLNIGIIGRSLLVGRPLSVLCAIEGGSVFLAHSKTKNFEIMKGMDVVISATGQRGLKSSYLPERGVIIDVGIWIDPETRKVRGDWTQHDQLPGEVVLGVPGGVGPLTVAALCLNACRHERIVGV